MRGVNKAILLGNVGNDPELKHMPNGNVVVNFSLATSESWKDKNTGEKQERTEWHRCTAYGRTAEVVAHYVTKGSKLFIEGKIQTRSWEQDGVKRYATEIIVGNLQMLGSAEKKQEQQPAQQPAQSPDFDNFDDDTPF